MRKLTADKQQYELSRDEQAQLERIVDPATVLKTLKEEKIVANDTMWKNVPFYHPTESLDHPSGYSGRVGIYEVLTMSPTIKELIMSNATGDAIHDQARKDGMMSMSEDGIFKAAQGLTSIEEVLRVITE